MFAVKSAVFSRVALSIYTIEYKQVFAQSCCLAYLSVCRLVSRSVQWGKMTDCIWMSFGLVSGVGRAISVLDGVKIVECEGQFWGECGASQCNQWELHSVVVRNCVHRCGIVVWM